MRYFILGAFLFTIGIYQTQAKKIEGFVYENINGKKEPLQGAAAIWKKEKTGAITDENGRFSLTLSPKKSDYIVVSYMGYKTDTLTSFDGVLDIQLEPETLEGIEVIAKDRGNYLSKLSTITVEKVTGAELHKAACCNLSESFETNASVDVTYNDAVSGAKQIKMLGLSGLYTQLLTENYPNLRGIASNYGLTYVPGPWMQSIQISKGASSVMNGYESTTGQINVEYKKPDAEEWLHLNVFQSLDLATEFNGIISGKINDKLSTGLLVYGKNFQNKVDDNNDNFLDRPLNQQVQVFNRWKYTSPKGYMFQFGVKGLYEKRVGGQTDFEEGMEHIASNPYGVEITNKRGEFFLKGGYTFKNGRNSIAFISNTGYHELDSYYGLRNYDAKEANVYTNLVLTSSLDKEEKHSLNSGVSFLYNDVDNIFISNNFQQRETVPGVFAEYTWKPSETITAMAGIRADFHNIFGTFYTPRFHLRYQPYETLTLRGSAGKGYRTTHLYADNAPLLASGRNFNPPTTPSQEEAWNYGLNALQQFTLWGRDLSLSAEYFRTDFLSQVVVDRESSQSEILFYELDGKSFADNYQIEMRYEVLPRLDMTLAYRYNNVKQTIGSELKDMPLTNKWKGIAVFNYTDKLKKWMFDYTTQFNGKTRIPITPTASEPNPKEQWSDNYIIMNAQITRYFRRWNIYAGAENLTAYSQKNPILDYQNPYSTSFDATQIWAPTHGARVYVGIRVSLNRQN
ncbi:MAG: TonB-dependent receptor domain-containing protein [Bacteroidales bacterium]